MERLARVDRPERVGDHVENGQQEDERERAQLGLVADGDENDESAADQIEKDVKELKVHAHERQEHDDEQDASDKLQIVLGRVVAESGHAGKQALGIWSILDEQENETTRQ